VIEREGKLATLVCDGCGFRGQPHRIDLDLDETLLRTHARGQRWTIDEKRQLCPACSGAFEQQDLFGRRPA
jgi:hypothetical protein